ncbi:MAG: hypothetical protein EA362_03890 [Saprospirales bacterium]|nr:MAG: hypothetical protein EA362_03890 [Saprospirales bacterium]
MSKDIKIDELIAVTGLPGLHKMVANRPNGLIVENPADGKRKFCSVRKHQFTPMGGVSIFTITDSTPMPKVFHALYLLETEGGETISANLSNDDQKEIFQKAVPDYDPDRVTSGDIKKVIKWYCFLRDQEIVDLSKITEEEE